MNERAQKMGIGTAALAFALAAATGGSQTTGGQMPAAQSLANQARSGQSSVAPGSVARAPQPAAAAQAAPSAATTAAPAGARRDPFRPLVIKGKGDDIPARLPPGKGGLVIGQLTVQGIVRSLDGQWIAVVDNKTKRAYFLYSGDELYNGTVSRITENTVVFAERVSDPTGRQQAREVVKQMQR